MLLRMFVEATHGFDMQFVDEGLIVGEAGAPAEPNPDMLNDGRVQLLDVVFGDHSLRLGLVEATEG